VPVTVKSTSDYAVVSPDCVAKHGRYSKQAIAERKLYRGLIQECRETLEAIRK